MNAEGRSLVQEQRVVGNEIDRFRVCGCCVEVPAEITALDFSYRFGVGIEHKFLMGVQASSKLRKIDDDDPSLLHDIAPSGPATG
jgi:hypothetical protein